MINAPYNVDGTALYLIDKSIYKTNLTRYVHSINYIDKYYKVGCLRNDVCRLWCR